MSKRTDQKVFEQKEDLVCHLCQQKVDSDKLLGPTRVGEKDPLEESAQAMTAKILQDLEINAFDNHNKKFFFLKI